MLVALASATAIAILLPAGPDDGCPSPRQVSDAVSAHLPGVVLPLGRAPGPSALRLSVTSDGAGTLRVDLSDPQGGALLRRRVAPETAARTKAAECVALAETAALIVDRYWHEVGYEVPPAAASVVPKPPPRPPAEPKPAPVPPEPAPPEPEPTSAEPDAVERPVSSQPERPRGPPHPPDWWLAAGVGGQVGDRGRAHPSASLSFAVERPVRHRRLGLRFSVSGLYPDWPTWSGMMGGATITGNAAVVQVPVGMDAYLAFPVRVGRLEPGLGLNLTIISATSAQGTRSDAIIGAAPGLDASLAWRIPLPHDLFVRALVMGAASFPNRIADDVISHVIIETPRFWAELGLQLGLSFY
ncbi:MAG: hypothetical protein ACJ8F1_19735 [Polyangia bacterium]